VTDEQAWAGRAGADPLAAVPDHGPACTWNLAGEKLGHGPSGVGFRHTFGGLTGHSFTMIGLLEAGRSALRASGPQRRTAVTTWACSRMVSVPSWPGWRPKPQYIATPKSSR
jgi:hypothetical protein